MMGQNFGTVGPFSAITDAKPLLILEKVQNTEPTPIIQCSDVSLVGRIGSRSSLRLLASFGRDLFLPRHPPLKSIGCPLSNRSSVPPTAPSKIFVGPTFSPLAMPMCFPVLDEQAISLESSKLGRWARISGSSTQRGPITRPKLQLQGNKMAIRIISLESICR